MVKRENVTVLQVCALAALTVRKTIAYEKIISRR
jgi:hypothetical protein